MGFIGIMVLEVNGGLGFGYVEVGIVFEEIGCNLMLLLFLIIVVVVVEVLKVSGWLSEEWLLKIVGGVVIVVFVIDEGGKY